MLAAKKLSVARLNLRHEPAALLCRFDWLHLGRVHNLTTSNNKSPSQELTQRSERRVCLHTLPSRKEEDESQGDLGGGNTLFTEKRQPEKQSFFRESARASMLFHYSQIIKELCSFVNLHSHDTHRDYTTPT